MKKSVKFFENEFSRTRCLPDGHPDNGVFRFGESCGWLQLPDNYDISNPHPLILFFHGRGGKVDENNFTSDEFMCFRTLCSEKGYVVAVPGYGSDCWMNDAAERITLEMLEFLEKKLSIDWGRLYVMGCSMGGAAALVFTARHSEKVKATCNVFGITDFIKFYNAAGYQGSIAAAYGGNPERVPEVYRSRSGVFLADKLKDKPLLVIHGDSDELVPKQHSDELVTALKENGGNPRYIVVTRMGHNNAIVRGLENEILDFFGGKHLVRKIKD